MMVKEEKRRVRIERRKAQLQAREIGLTEVVQ